MKLLGWAIVFLLTACATVDSGLEGILDNQSEGTLNSEEDKGRNTDSNDNTDLYPDSAADNYPDSGSLSQLETTMNTDISTEPDIEAPDTNMSTSTDTHSDSQLVLDGENTDAGVDANTDTDENADTVADADSVGDTDGDTDHDDTGTDSDTDSDMDQNDDISTEFDTSSKDTEPENRLVIEEKEDGYCSADGLIEEKHSGFFGEGYINTHNEADVSIVWSIDSKSGGPVSMSWRYATTNDRLARLLINKRVVVEGLEFTSTDMWNVWSTLTETVSLFAGTNTIRLEAESKSGLANIDSFAVVGSGLHAEECLNKL